MARSTANPGRLEGPGEFLPPGMQRRPRGKSLANRMFWDPMFGAQARLPGECQADGAFPCGQSEYIARPSSPGAWLERPRLSWAGAQKCEKNNPKSASAPYTRPTTTPDDPTDAFQVVSGTNWDPKARVLRGHAPSFAMPRPGPTSEVSTVKSAPARPIFMPLLCQQPLFHPRTEAISGSNWSQLTLKWPQFLGGRRAEKQAFVPGGLGSAFRATTHAERHEHPHSAEMLSCTLLTIQS